MTAISLEAIANWCLWHYDQIRLELVILCDQSISSWLFRCRKCPAMMLTLKHYCVNGKLSIDLLEDWKHYQRIGLPPIEYVSTTVTVKDKCRPAEYILDQANYAAAQIDRNRKLNISKALLYS